MIKDMYLYLNKIHCLLFNVIAHYLAKTSIIVETLSLMSH